MTAQLCRRFGLEPKCSAPECVKGGTWENVVRMQRWFPNCRCVLILLKILKISNYRIELSIPLLVSF